MAKYSVARWQNLHFGDSRLRAVLLNDSEPDLGMATRQMGASLQVLEVKLPQVRQRATPGLSKRRKCRKNGRQIVRRHCSGAMWRRGDCDPVRRLTTFLFGGSRRVGGEGSTGILPVIWWNGWPNHGRDAVYLESQAACRFNTIALRQNS